MLHHDHASTGNFKVVFSFLPSILQSSLKEEEEPLDLDHVALSLAVTVALLGGCLVCLAAELLLHRAQNKATDPTKLDVNGQEETAPKH